MGIAGSVNKKSTIRTLLRIHEEIPKTWYLIGIGASFISLFLLWYICNTLGLVQEIFLPTPVAVMVSLFTSLADSDFWSQIGISVYRVFMGFFLACLIGIPLGILAGTFKVAESFIVPMSEFIRYMPAAAFIPLIMVWAGIGETAKILVIFIGCFFQLLLMVADDTSKVNKDLLSASYTLGAKRRKPSDSLIQNSFL
jgi:NitT/TauT family transport system permease protein